MKAVRFLYTQRLFRGIGVALATHQSADNHLLGIIVKTCPQFVEMHRPVRHLKGDGKYFACSDFRKPGSKDEYYDLDFWVDEDSGDLKVKEVKVHKVPVQEDGIWTQVDRYTFEGMDFEETL